MRRLTALSIRLPCHSARPVRRLQHVPHSRFAHQLQRRLFHQAAQRRGVLEVNGNLTVSAHVESEDVPWMTSPTKGVSRRMLDRKGGEVARATTIVRFEPGKTFPEHVHELGEEFFVLSGVFSDQIQGDYHAGTYARHPPGTSHSPWSHPGCTLLVKLRQMVDSSEPVVKVDTRSKQAPWQDKEEGRRSLELWWNENTGERVWMEEWSPRFEYKGTLPEGGEELFVLDGMFQVPKANTIQYPTTPWETSLLHAPTHFRRGAWCRHPSSLGGSAVTRVAGDAGCRLWLKSGHLEMERREAERRKAAEPVVDRSILGIRWGSWG